MHEKFSAMSNGEGIKIFHSQKAGFLCFLAVFIFLTWIAGCSGESGVTIDSGDRDRDAITGGDGDSDSQDGDAGKEEDVDSDQPTDGDQDPSDTEDEIVSEEEPEEIPCPNGAADCPTGLGCIEGICSVCSDGSHCRDREGCIDGVCGTCAAAEHCATPKACINGDCWDNCATATDCREDEGCLTDTLVCGSCQTAPDCWGRLCSDGGCSDCESDEECHFDYGSNDYFCCTVGRDLDCVSGVCLRNSCDTPGEGQCWVTGTICDGQFCIACENDRSCFDEYGPGFLCRDGACRAEGICENSADCPQDVPICGTDGHCRACIVGNDQECDERFSSDDDPPGGSWMCVEGAICVYGDCESVDDCRNDNKICSNYWCSPCIDINDDAVCQSAYSSNYLCIGGKCLQGDCHKQADCNAEGTVCRENTCTSCTTLGDNTISRDDACSHADAYGPGYLCHEGECLEGDCHGQTDCSDGTICHGNNCRVCSSWDTNERDTACAAAFGDSVYICENDRCERGCTSGSACDDGEVCGEDHRCRACNEDNECKDAYGNPNYICNYGVCERGCIPGEACGPGLVKLCADDNRCRACDEGYFSDQTETARDLRCKQAYPNHYICSAGECIAGCRIPSGNGSQVCGDNNRWQDCTTDGQCKSAYSAQNKICEEGVCTEMCTTPYESCYDGDESKICNTDYRCIDCWNDQICKTAYNVNTYVCNGDSGGCEAGCESGFACETNKICKNNRCEPCIDQVDDVLCNSIYPDHICVAGECISGNCRSDETCLEHHDRQICSNFECRACDPDINLKCPTGYVCDEGECFRGDCISAADCGGGTCTNHLCQGCNVGTDCLHNYANCLDRTNACNNGSCRSVEELIQEGAVYENWCLIQGTCYTSGTQHNDADNYPCLMCFPDESMGGSRTSWTPGRIDPVEGFETTDCFIDGRCRPPGAGNPTSEQSAECLWCQPQIGVRESLVDWSPREDGGVAYEERLVCHDPLFEIPDPSLPGHTMRAPAPSYSGGLTKGYCYEGVCRGTSWTPWLPVGPTGAGTATTIDWSGSEHHFIGSFGGGFGSGVTSTSPASNQSR